MNGYAGFYRFLGLHSLLIGLFPFFIPVFLWNSGFSLSAVCVFIAVSGLAFCCCLRLWEHAALNLSLRALMSLTLVLELLLLAINLGFDTSTNFLLLFAAANGLYNCFFWTTQRTLFLNLITTADSGRQYGNFQIFVMVFLKSGIFIGGFLLESFGYVWVFCASVLVVVTALLYLRTQDGDECLPSCQPISFKKTLSFTDSQRSRTIFLADGLFLFLESHFWTISLFMLSAQNYARLGIVVIVLAVLFALLFYVAKNTIDRLTGARVYQIAVLMYAVSWWLRPAASEHMATQWLLALLLAITFFSSFFRLAFNKRFYDIAKQSSAREYLLIKSYYTQMAVAVIFGLLAALALFIDDAARTLQLVYLGSGFLALGYMLYRPQYGILASEKE